MIPSVWLRLDAVMITGEHQASAWRAPWQAETPVGYTVPGPRSNRGPPGPTANGSRMIKGLGVDAIEIARIARVHTEYPERFLARILTAAERDYVLRFADPAPRIAGRFAVKEACMKALGTGWGNGVRWRDIEVTRLPGGAPVVRLHGRAAEIMRGRGASVAHCTITHTDDHAMAVVILE